MSQLLLVTDDSSVMNDLYFQLLFQFKKYNVIYNIILGI